MSSFLYNYQFDKKRMNEKYGIGKEIFIECYFRHMSLGWHALVDNNLHIYNFN